MTFDDSAFPRGSGVGPGTLARWTRAPRLRDALLSRVDVESSVPYLLSIPTVPGAGSHPGRDGGGDVTDRVSEVVDEDQQRL